MNITVSTDSKRIKLFNKHQTKKKIQEYKFLSFNFEYYVKSENLMNVKTNLYYKKFLFADEKKVLEVNRVSVLIHAQFKYYKYLKYSLDLFGIIF